VLGETVRLQMQSAIVRYLMPRTGQNVVKVNLPVRSMGGWFYSPDWNLWLKSAPPCAPGHLVDTDQEKTRLSEGAKGRKRAHHGGGLKGARYLAPSERRAFSRSSAHQMSREAEGAPGLAF
jgi:hypothetical protein